MAVAMNLAGCCCACSGLGNLFHALTALHGNRFSVLSAPSGPEDTCVKQGVRVIAEVIRILAITAIGLGSAYFAVSIWGAPVAAGLVSAVLVGFGEVFPLYVGGFGALTLSHLLNVCYGGGGRQTS